LGYKKAVWPEFQKEQDKYRSQYAALKGFCETAGLDWLTERERTVLEALFVIDTSPK
jgi:hypothetical protein